MSSSYDRMFSRLLNSSFTKKVYQSLIIMKPAQYKKQVLVFSEAAMDNAIFILYAISYMLYLICFICCDLSAMLYLLCFIFYALSAMLYLLCFICYALSALLYLICSTAMFYLLSFICYALPTLLYMLLKLFKLYN